MRYSTPHEIRLRDLGFAVVRATKPGTKLPVFYSGHELAIHLFRQPRHRLGLNVFRKVHGMRDAIVLSVMWSEQEILTVLYLPSEMWETQLKHLASGIVPPLTSVPG